MPKETPKQREDRLRLYQAYQEAGTSVKEFAEERGTTYWRVKSAIKKTELELGGRAFQEVSLPGSLESEYEIRLGNGRELRVKGPFSEKRLEQLLRVLDRC